MATKPLPGVTAKPLSYDQFKAKLKAARAATSGNIGPDVATESDFRDAYNTYLQGDGAKIDKWFGSNHFSDDYTRQQHKASQETATGRKQLSTANSNVKDAQTALTAAQKELKGAVTPAAQQAAQAKVAQATKDLATAKGQVPAAQKAATGQTPSGFDTGGTGLGSLSKTADPWKSVAGNFADTQIKGLYTLLNLPPGQPGQKVTLRDAIAQFANLKDPATIAMVQNMLYKSQRYASGYVPVLGAQLNSEDIKAFASMAGDAAMIGANINDYLIQSVTTTQQAGTSLAGQPAKIQLTDTQTISERLKAAFQAALGRDPNSGEIARFVAQYQGEESAARTSAAQASQAAAAQQTPPTVAPGVTPATPRYQPPPANSQNIPNPARQKEAAAAGQVGSAAGTTAPKTSTTVTQAPTLDAAAQQFAANDNPQFAQAHDLLNTLDMFNQIMSSRGK